MWLQNNIRSLIALIFSIGSLVIFIIMLRYPVKTADNMTLIIVTSICNMEVFVLGYYFGSTKNPATKLDAAQQELLKRVEALMLQGAGDPTKENSPINSKTS